MRTIHSFMLAAILSLGFVVLSAPADAADNTLALIALGGERGTEGLRNQQRELSTSGVGQRSPGRAFAIDYVGGEKGTALNFTIKLSGSGLSAKRSESMDFGNCVAGLPASHMGECRFHPETGELKVVIFSMSNALLGTGSIGTITLPPGFSASLKPESVTLSDRDGNRVDLEVL